MNWLNDALQGWTEIEYWYEIACLGLQGAVRLGVAAGLLAAVVLVVNVLFRRWMSAGQMALLWGLVLVRLVLTFAPESRLSLWGVVLHAEQDTYVTAPPPADAPDMAEWVPGAQPLGAEYQVIDALPVLPALVAAAESATTWLDVATVVSPFLWLAGVVLIPAVAIVRHARFCRRVRRLARPVDARVQRLWDECRSAAGYRAVAAVCCTQAVPQPAVIGAWRGRLLLPTSAAEWSDERLRMVMLHEVGHLKHFDLAGNWLLLFIRAVQWWNPVYWLTAMRYRNLREQACDAFALRHLEGMPAAEYGRELLELATAAPVPRWSLALPASLVSLLWGRLGNRGLKGRLKALSAARVERGRGQRVAFGAVVLAAALCGLTNPPMHANETEPVVDWIPRVFEWQSQWSFGQVRDDAPLETRSYEVPRLLVQWTAESGSRERAEFLLRVTLESMLGVKANAETTASEKEAGVEVPAVTIADDEVHIHASSVEHVRLGRMLSAWETAGPLQISLECRLINSPRDLVAELGLDWEHFTAGRAAHDGAARVYRGTTRGVYASAEIDDSLPTAVTTLSHDEVRALVQLAQGDARANVIFAPKMTLFNGQTGTIQSKVERPFVTGLKATAAGEVEPEIEVVSEGVMLDFFATARDANSEVELDASIALSSVEDVRVARAIVAGKEQAIQIPRVRRSRIGATGAVPQGKSLLVGCLPAYESTGFFYVLLTPRVLEEELVKELAEK